jgi:hypothetical protein
MGLHPVDLDAGYFTKPQGGAAFRCGSFGRRLLPIVATVGLSLLCLSSQAALYSVDNADNDPYRTENDWLPGQNGGQGYQPWVKLNVEPYYGASYLTLTSLIDGHLASWGMNGYFAMGRGLESPQPFGTLRLLATHGSDNTGFSGFSLKASTDPAFANGELLRFGMVDSGGTGIYVSYDAGANYDFLNCNWVDARGDALAYTITWDASGTYTLTVDNFSEQTSSSFGGTIPTDTVLMFGAAVFGPSLSDQLAFDGAEVGTVPEPATIVPAVAVLMTALVHSIRNRRRAVGYWK